MQVAELARGLGDEQADLPMAGVEAECDGSAVLGAETAVGAEDEELGVEETGGLPSHAGVLGEAEEISGGLGEKHLGRDGKRALGTAGVGLDALEEGSVAFENAGD